LPDDASPYLRRPDLWVLLAALMLVVDTYFAVYTYPMISGVSTRVVITSVLLVGVLIIGSLVVISFYLQPQPSADTTGEVESLALVERGEPVDRFCANYEEIEQFAEPIPIVWMARMDGCLVGCQGGSFTNLDQSASYPRFAGYNPGLSEAFDGSVDNPIPRAYVGQTLEITGNWIAIDIDHPLTVFNDQCVPIVDIASITVVSGL